MPSPTTTTSAPLAPAPSDREDYPPDRSSYQPLPDDADTLDDGNTLLPLEADPDAEQDDDALYNLESFRSEYKRSSQYAAPLAGFVRRDIGIVRRAAKPQPLSPVLSLVGGVRGEKGGFAASSTTTTTSTTTTKPAITTSATTATTAANTASAAAAAGVPQPLHRPHHQHKPRSSDTRSKLPATTNSAPRTLASTAAIPNLPDQVQGDRAALDVQDQPAAQDDSESISEESSISSVDEMEEEESWIASFCNVIGHEYFAEVSEDFIEDDFNLTGLGAVVPMYKEALEMILDVEPEDDSESPGSASESLSENPAGPSYRRQRGHTRTASDYSMIETSAEMLYGLIHQRFITSRQGIQVMYDKYLANHFGFCPRVNCVSARVLPCGYSDTPGTETVKLFCPSCCDIYIPPNSRFQSVDGAYFGTTFPTLFLMTFPELEIVGNGRKDVTASNTLNSAGGRKGAANNTLAPINGVPANNIAPGLGKGHRYEMRIYGFRVNERARSGPRMGWLREKPEDLEDLNEMTKSGKGAGPFGSDDDGMGSASDDDEEEEEEEEEDEDMAFPADGTGRSLKRGAPATATGSEIGAGNEEVR